MGLSLMMVTTAMTTMRMMMVVMLMMVMAMIMAMMIAIMVSVLPLPAGKNTAVMRLYAFLRGVQVGTRVSKVLGGGSGRVQV